MSYRTLIEGGYVVRLEAVGRTYEEFIPELQPGGKRSSFTDSDLVASSLWDGIHALFSRPECIVAAMVLHMSNPDGNEVISDMQRKAGEFLDSERRGDPHAPTTNSNESTPADPPSGTWESL